MANEEFLPLFCNLYMHKDLKKTHQAELNRMWNNKLHMHDKKLLTNDCDWSKWTDMEQLLKDISKYCKEKHYTIFGSIFAKIGTNKALSDSYQITLKKGQLQKTRMEFRCSVPRKKK